MMKMMKGTGGSADYVVIDKADHLLLGLKPVSEVYAVNPNIGPETKDNEIALVMNYGIRVRAAPDPEDKTVYLKNIGEVVDLVFKDIGFNKKMNTHASFFLGRSGPCPAYIFLHLDEILEGPEGKAGLLEAMWEALGREIQDEHFSQVSKKEVKDWVLEELEKKLRGLRKQYFGFLDKEGKQEPKGEGEILMFPMKEETKDDQ